MGALDRLAVYQGNKAMRTAMGVPTMPEVTDMNNMSEDEQLLMQFFDFQTPLGYFMRSLHRLGYKVVDTFYRKGNAKELTSVEYNALPEEDKVGYQATVKKTEFAEMLLADGDVLAISSAGSGKTTALTFKIMKDIITGECTVPVAVKGGTMVNTLDSIFVGTFLKTGAEELKTNLAYWQKKLGYVVTAERIHFGTLHAEFKRVLNAMGVVTRIGSATELNKLLHKAIDSFGIRTSEGKSLTFDDYVIIESVLTYYRNRLDNAKYAHPSCDDYSLTPTMLDALYNNYQGLKREEGIMDFEDLQELLYQYLYVTPNPAVQDYVANRYNYIYLDEFQDTSQIQYAILKFYARGRLAMNKDKDLAEQMRTESSIYYNADLDRNMNPKGKFVAIGDDDQAIYSWRGSDVNIITTDFVRDFAPQVVMLSTNYRCPANILNPVITSITKNRTRYNKPLRSARDGGEFAIYSFNNLVNMANFMLDSIEKDILEGRNVAIICRTNFDGTVPALLLERRHKFTFSISSNSMTLDSPMAKAITEATSLFTERNSATVKKVLRSIVPFSAKYEVDELMGALRNDDSVHKRVSIWNVDEDDFRHSCPALANIFIPMRALMYDPSGKKIPGGEIAALEAFYWYLMSYVYRKDNAYCIKMRAYIAAILDVLKNGDFPTVHDFLNELNEINDGLNAKIKEKGQLISIVTVHEFKGKERDSVYVWNDSVDVFPTTKTDLNRKEEVEEERRVHYIACTRAKQKCNILTLAGNVGIFVKEMSAVIEDKTSQGITQTVLNKSAVSEEEEDTEQESTTAQKDKERLEGVSFDDAIPAV